MSKLEISMVILKIIKIENKKALPVVGLSILKTFSSTLFVHWPPVVV